MHIEQLYTNCLAHAAYYIESEGEAAVIDPLRDADVYLGMAERRGATIRYIFETHFHADFVSGHVDLARKTGAQLVFGPRAQTNYTIHTATDGEEFKLGKITIRALHTPGHTLESTCYLLLDENRRPHAVFTGDTLFIGDVGRPDLAIKSDLTQHDLAGMLYDSLHTKILPLPDDVIVYPGHGAGSACGKNLSKETWQTLGNQRELNYALRAGSREEFIREVTEGLSAPPQYFAYNAQLNKLGYNALDDVLHATLRPLKPESIDAETARGAWILDTRTPEAFGAGHIPGSLNIGLNGQYAPWVGALIPFGQRLVLVAEPGKEEEAVLRLARVGYENVAGYLEGGIGTWKAAGKAVAEVKSILPEAFPAEAAHARVLDVRNPGEWQAGHVAGALHIPLAEVAARAAELDPNTPWLVHCAGGYRSMIAASLLERAGFHNLVNVSGGFNAMKAVPGIRLSLPESTPA